MVGSFIFVVAFSDELPYNQSMKVVSMNESLKKCQKDAIAF